jgi:hypothetical protein
MTDQEKPQNRGTLNVIVHGSVAIYDSQKGDYPILAMLPKHVHGKCNGARCDRHVYRAGNWLGETELSEGSYDLMGVTGGTAAFDPTKTLILKSAGPQEKQAHVVMRLPRPQAIESLRVVIVPFQAFNQEEAEALKLDQQGVPLATLHVLTYTFKDDNDLRLASTDKQDDGHYWEPAFNGDFINLHIFCSEDRFSTPSQASADFKACTALLGLKLELEHPQPVPLAESDVRLPDGVIAEETEDLPFRTLRMARLGRLFSQKGDTNRAWSGNDALDCPEACTPPVGAP